MTESIFVKRPEELLDYAIDMSAELAGRGSGGDDTISSCSWSIVPPNSAPVTLAVQASTATGSSVTVWLSGGTKGSTYQVLALLHTATGRIYEPSFKLEIC